MTKSFFLSAAAAACILGFAGCESTGGIPARAHEKSAVYATLKPWEKKYLDRGSVAVGFTPDMVYIALGHPSTIAVGHPTEEPVELWTYARCYPTADAIRGFKQVRLTLNSSTATHPVTEKPDFPKPAPSDHVLAAQTVGGETRGSSPPSISKTSGPQGGSMEPADLPSYTIQVLFENGQVTRLSAVPNSN